MKTIFLLSVFLISITNLSAQTNPDIEGDTMLCPDTEGTAYVTNPVFDTYQWYFKYWFLPDEFMPIEGATESTFTYDWYTYDQALLKVIATLDGQPYESDTLQIDSYAWLPIFTMYELTEGVTFDPETETFILEEGAEFPVSINNPPYDTLIQWYRDGDSIEGATNATYVITDAGTYYATAAPSFCPGSISTTLPMVVTMAVDIPLIEPDVAGIYPNPASDELNIDLTGNTQFRNIIIMDLSGRIIMQSPVETGINKVAVQSLKSGIYLVKLKGDSVETTGRFIKK
jgi:hypothetical protein